MKMLRRAIDRENLEYYQENAYDLASTDLLQSEFFFEIKFPVTCNQDFH